MAIVSRRAPAFQPLPGERPGLAWAVRAALPGPRRQERAKATAASDPPPAVPATDPVVTVEPWRWSQVRAASVAVGSARSARVMPSLVGLVAACLLAAGGFALTTLAPGEVSAPAGPPPSSTAALGPQQTVERYFEAINAKDYRTAWNLGGRNFHQSYSTFAASFATTATTSVTIQSITGDVVAVILNTQDTEGKTHDYHGTYTVHDGVITAGSLKAG
ncbi:hypothetical protein [Actinacidiphila yeochonensis]|uniref:hypothetical protein n=1 Tax=Actinacidiphila yeochonensis TaxID=89050 RepID=UPI0012FF45A4|nr:hypothetical protein [Actinacidiphila yeochonensis]